MTGKEMLKRYGLLVIGIFFVGLGVAFAKHSNLGISPVSSVANVLSIRFPELSVGTWLMLWNFLLILGEILLVRGKFPLLQWLQIPISILLGYFTDWGLWMIDGIPVEYYAIRLLLVLFSVLVIGIGILLMVVSNTVMNVGEAFVNVVAQKVNRNFGSVKVVFDICSVSLAILLSMLFFDGQLLGIREGTIITACTTGFAVKTLSARFKTPLEHILTGKPRH